jgi:hypothetical protein
LSEYLSGKRPTKALVAKYASERDDNAI